MKKKLLILLMIFIMMFSLATCVMAKTTLEKVKEQNFVTVGFANEAPFAYATTSGELTGQNVEIAKAVLKELGIEEVVGVLTEFGSLIPGLKAGRFDIITAGMFITPEREKEVDFANPEYQIGLAITVEKGNPFDIHSYEDIAKNQNIKVAVMAGSTDNLTLKALNIKDNQIVTVPDQPSALAVLQAGRVDAITMTSLAMDSLLDKAKSPNIERVIDFRNPVVNGKEVLWYGSSAFRPEDDDFRSAYNQALKKLKESGVILEIQNKFGLSDQYYAPSDVTVEDVLNNWLF